MRTVIVRRGLMGFPSEPQENPQAVWAEALTDDDGGGRTLYLHIPFCRSRSAIRNRYRLKTIKNDIQKRERNTRKGWKKTYSSASADCSI